MTIHEAIDTYLRGIEKQEHNARRWGSVEGRRYAKLFWEDNGSKNVVSFVDLTTGKVHRADSAKKAGMVVGDIFEFAAKLNP